MQDILDIDGDGNIDSEEMKISQQVMKIVGKDVDGDGQVDHEETVFARRLAGKTIMAEVYCVSEKTLYSLLLFDAHMIHDLGATFRASGPAHYHTCSQVQLYVCSIADFRCEQGKPREDGEIQPRPASVHKWRCGRGSGTMSFPCICLALLVCQGEVPRWGRGGYTRNASTHQESDNLLA